MERRQEILEATKIEDKLNRHMAVASIIAKELERKGAQAVIVGGTAVEFYTVGGYTTHDIDFIANKTEHIKEVMISLGFLNDGGTWYIPETPVAVEFPSGPLDGDWNRIEPVILPQGTVNVIGIEDIISLYTCIAELSFSRREENVSCQ